MSSKGSVLLLFLCTLFVFNSEASAYNMLYGADCTILAQGTQVLLKLQQEGKYKTLKRDQEKKFIIEIKDCYFPEVKKTVQTFDSMVGDIKIAQVSSNIVQIVLTMLKDTDETVFWDENTKNLVVQVSKSKGIKKVEKKEETKARKLSELEIKARDEEERILKRLSSASTLKKFNVDTVVIDPGHGGFDSGAVGPTGLKEKDVNLDISKRLKQLVQNHTGTRVFLTRTGDYYLPLSERTIIANQYQADLFISIHSNASKKREAHGVEFYYPSETASDKEAALVAVRENAIGEKEEFFKKKSDFIDVEDILFKFERKLYWEDSRAIADKLYRGLDAKLGIRGNGVKYANFFVLRKARMPAVLFETAYISNPKEEQLLKSNIFKQKVAEELFERIKGLL